MKLKFYFLTGCALMMAAGFFFAESAFAKRQQETSVPHAVLLLDTPPPVYYLPGLSPRDTITSVHVDATVPVDNNPAQTVNPE